MNKVNRKDHDDAAFRLLISVVMEKGTITLKFDSQRTAAKYRSSFYKWRKFWNEAGEPGLGAGILLRVQDESLILTTQTARADLRQAMLEAGIPIPLPEDHPPTSGPMPVKKAPGVAQLPVVVPESHFSAALAESGLSPTTKEDKGS